MAKKAAEKQQKPRWDKKHDPINAAAVMEDIRRYLMPASKTPPPATKAKTKKAKGKTDATARWEVPIDPANNEVARWDRNGDPANDAAALEDIRRYLSRR